MWILNGRRSETGRGLRETIEAKSTGFPADRLHVIFVHGFNKDAPEARSQADTFFGLLAGKGVTERNACLGVYLWPATRNGRSFWSALDYPWIIPRAQRSGRLLGDYLAAMRFANLVLIGHSLGAVVALEASLRFTERWGGTHHEYKTLRTLLLTGAAVRSSDMRHDGRYGERRANEEVVLYCTRDLTLKTLFGPGQRVAQPFEAVSPAVGLTGLPTERDWTALETNVRLHTYWKENCTADVVNQIVHGQPVRIVDRELPTRSLPTRGIG